MTLRVRPARPADAAAVAAIHVDVWRAAYVGLVPDAYLDSLSVERYVAMWRGNIDKGTPSLLVATDDADTVLGWLAFGASRDPNAAADVAEVWAIYVGAPHWGRGVGRALWERARLRLREAGFTSIGLWAFPTNERAGRFYRGLGFSIEPGSQKQFELGGATLDEVRFVRSLDDAAP